MNRYIVQIIIEAEDFEEARDKIGYIFSGVSDKEFSNLNMNVFEECDLS